MIWKPMPWDIAPGPPLRGAETAQAVLFGLARVLRAAAARVVRWARALDAVRSHRAPPAAAPQIEFYAEAGAPEGALYVDGRLLGRIEGVTRL